MKTRRHHNNKGLRTIRLGKTRRQVEEMAKRILGKNSLGQKEDPGAVFPGQSQSSKLSCLQLASLSHNAAVMSRGYLDTLARVQKWSSRKAPERSLLAVDAVVVNPHKTGNGQVVDPALNGDVLGPCLTS